MVTFLPRVPRALFALSLSAGLAAHAQLGDTPGEGPQVPSAAARHIEPVPVQTPEAELATFRLVPGFHIELVAAEPLVHDPVGAAYDHDGNLWVIEMTPFNAGLVKDYPQLAGGATTVPDGKIVRLESSHHDGHYDRRVEWLTGLNAPRVIRIVKDGVLVGDPPNLWLAQDTQHTGKCDKKTLLLNDYGAPGSEEGSANGLLWGRDNLLHNISFEYDYDYRDGAIRRRLPRLVRGQFGLAQDDFGRLFYSRNSDQLRCDEFAPRYNVRNPDATEFPWANVRVPVSQEVWPSHPTPAVNRGYRSGVMGQQTGGLRPDGTLLEFTAACSSQIYRGENFPARFYGNAFVPEPGANLIKRDLLLEAQGQITAVNAYEGREFLTSTDGRFRPVALVNAPDGSFLVADMYRGILEEYHILTSYLRDQTMARGLNLDQYGHGRLWRITYEGGPVNRTEPHLDALSGPDLVKLLASRNSWWRDTAQQMLVERKGQDAVPALEDAAVRGPDAATRVCALWTLDGLEATNLSLLNRALRDPAAQVRAAAVRLHEKWLAGPDAAAALAQLRQVAADPEPAVRVQLALSLGEAPSAEGADFLYHLLLSSGDHPFMAKAIVTGLRGREWDFYRRIAADAKESGPRPELAAMVTVLASAIVHQATRAQENGLLADAADASGQPLWLRRAILAGLEDLTKPAFRRSIGATRVLPAAALAPLVGSHEPAIGDRAKKLSDRLQRDEDQARSRMKGHPLSAADKALYAEGQVTYQICMACHQANGEGLANVAPSLVDSNWVPSNPGLLVRILLNGKEGTPGFPAAMPPIGANFSDRQLAGVLTYIRNSWGLQAGAVSPELVQRMRARYGKRTAAWTNSELERAQLHPIAEERASSAQP